MFCLIDLKEKDAPFYCVLSERTKHHLLQIKKRNVITVEYDDDINQNIPENKL